MCLLASLICVRLSPLAQGCCRCTTRQSSILSMQCWLESTFTLRCLSSMATSVPAMLVVPQPETMPTLPVCLLAGLAERQTGPILAENVKLVSSFNSAMSYGATSYGLTCGLSLYWWYFSWLISSLTRRKLLLFSMCSNDGTLLLYGSLCPPTNTNSSSSASV